MVLLFGGTLDQVLDDDVEIDKIKRRLQNYHWRKDTLFFKDLVLPKLEERHGLFNCVHEEIGHFNEGHWMRSKKGFFGMIEYNM